MHIGLIGGIGPGATSYYYLGLTRAAAVADRPLELTIVHAQLAEMREHLLSGQPEPVARDFAALSQRLKAAGAEQMAITSLAGHFCIEPLLPISRLPIINAIPAVTDYLTTESPGRIGLLGTEAVMSSRLYGGLDAMDVVVPDGEDLLAASTAYMDMAAAGSASDAQRRELFRIGGKLVSEQGADLVLLAGTDMFLAFDGQDCGFPVIDSADIHIQAILHQALADDD